MGAVNCKVVVHRRVGGGASCAQSTGCDVKLEQLLVQAMRQGRNGGSKVFRSLVEGSNIIYEIFSINQPIRMSNSHLQFPSQRTSSEVDKRLDISHTLREARV